MSIFKFLLCQFILILAGCGGGGGSAVGAGSTTNAPVAPSLTFSGVAIDGYLKSAQAFLDLNDNGTYEDGEPVALTDSNGGFSFSATSSQMAAHSVVVAAIAGQTVDQDNPGVALTRGFTMMAPPGKPEVISPITTCVVARVNAGQTLSQAEASVKSDLGLSAIDVYKNYITAKVSDATYLQVHNLAAAMVEVAKNVESANPAMSLSQKLSAVNANVTSEVLSRLVAIKAASGATDARAIIAESVSTSTLQLYAAAANLTSLVNLSANTVTLSWTDSFPVGTRYDIKTQNADGSFTTVDSVSGAGGTNSTLTWSRALTAATSFRVDAYVSSTTFTLLTPQKQTTVSGTVPVAAPEIAVSGVEPVSVSVQLTIGNGLIYPSVTWYSDLRLIGTSTSGAGNPVTWNTSTETNSSHLIVAKIQVATDSFTEIRRTITVANSNLAVNGSASGTTGTINVDVSASSRYGIARVEASFDGAAATSLIDPNACSKYCPGNNLYRFSVNAASAGSGSHSMVVTAIDKQGGRKSVTVSVPISNLPVLTLTSPNDGAFVNGSLTLTGTSSSDKTGAVTVTASLSDYQFLNTTQANFSGSMNLSSLPPGTYTLTVRATDSSNAVTVLQRTVSVTSGTALTYSPTFTLGVNGQLISVDESNPSLVLYKADDGGYRVRNTSTNTEVTLQGASSIPYLYNWAMDGGYVYVSGGFLGSTTTGYSECPLICIYQWSPTGEKTNLSNTNPNAATSNVGGGRAYEEHPKAHHGHVIWIDAAGANAGTFTHYNVSTGSYSTIRQPSDASYLINTEYDFFVDASNNVVFFFGAQTGGEGTTSTFDVYRWSAATNTSTKLSSAGARSTYPQTDGQRVIWQQTASSAAGALTLISQGVTGGTLTTLASNAGSFQLRDGVAAWTESL